MSELSRKAATINDVAEAAGVSYQTVSRVINNHPSVKEDTRRRVKDAIRRLKYQPSSVARSLVMQRSNLIGLVSFGTLHFGPAQMLSSIEQAARARGYHLSIVSIPSLNRNELERAINTLRRQRVAGILVVAPLLGAETDFLRELGTAVPTVLVDADLGAGLPFSTIDQFAGGRLGVEHLLGLGHRRIALVNGPQDWNDARLRTQGWLNALRDAGLQPVVQALGDWSAASGYAAARELLGQGRLFTGLLVANDQMALGALKALREAGLRVPADVSVVGFDNTPESEYFDPPLTTVHQDFPSLGQASLAQLLSMIEAPATAPSLQVIPPTLMVRSSTSLAGGPEPLRAAAGPVAGGVGSSRRSKGGKKR
ncbi:MAG: LacI family DNA-binding transcriptional regulator [Meiothermus sp.]|nr:LacI family DNA-binding transcriptional regulator [Meiothermus sp.]